MLTATWMSPNKSEGFSRQKRPTTGEQPCDPLDAPTDPDAGLSLASSDGCACGAGGVPNAMIFPASNRDTRDDPKPAPISVPVPRQNAAGSATIANKIREQSLDRLLWCGIHRGDHARARRLYWLLMRKIDRRRGPLA